VSIDLRTEKSSGSCGSWVRCFGEHEANGFEVSLNNSSAHVTVKAVGIMFVVDRRDIPAAWEKPIDAIQLRSELLAAIVSHISNRVVEELFQEIHRSRAHAFHDGVHETQTKIREVLGL
jgi:hypothetical protein